jgi:hypothetical protein
MNSCTYLAILNVIDYGLHPSFSVILEYIPIY